MSYRSKRTKIGVHQGTQSIMSSSSVENQSRGHHPIPHASLQRQENQTTKPKQLGLPENFAPPPATRTSEAHATMPPKFTFPPHLDPKALWLSNRTASLNANLEVRSQPRDAMPGVYPQEKNVNQASMRSHPRQETQATSEVEINTQATNAPRNDVAEPEFDLPQQRNEQDNVRKSKPKRARSMKSRSVPLDQIDPLEIDEEEEVLAIDSENNKRIFSGFMSPLDIDNDNGVRFEVKFNLLNQPLRRGGSLFVKYLGYLAKEEKYCPIGAECWHKVNPHYKVDIVKKVRGKFIIPEGEEFNKVILSRVAILWKDFRFSLKLSMFNPDERTKEQIIKDVSDGHSKDNWMCLVEYWYSEKSKMLSSINKGARESSIVSKLFYMGMEQEKARYLEYTRS